MKRWKKHRRYKKYLEEGVSPPATSKLRNRVLNDSDSSSSSLDDEKEFYDLLRPKKINTSEINETESHSSVTKDIESSSVISDVEECILDDTSTIINPTEQYAMDYDIHYYEQQLPLNIRLNESIDYEMNMSDEDVTDNEAALEICDTRDKESFRDLKNKLYSKEFNEIVNSRFVVSKAEILYAMEKFIDQFSLPISALEYQCKMLNSFLSSPILPETKYSLDKLLRSNDSVQYHAVCPDCDFYIRQFQCNERTVECSECKKNVVMKGENGNYFIILNIEKDVKYMIEKHEQYYIQVMHNKQRQTTIFSDIYDGLEYKKFVDSLSVNEKNAYVTCTFNSDGSPVFKSTNYSIWPIQIQLNELPNNERFDRTIMCAMWFGKNKPNMNIFLKAFIAKIEQINMKGIQCEINNAVNNVKLYPVCCCVDSVARAPMQGHIQFNGSYGCSWCYHPGVKIKHKKRKFIKYPLLDIVPEMRSAIKTLEHMQSKLIVDEPVFGIKGISPLVQLKCYDIVNGFVPDVMHCVFLGICRQFAHFWFDLSAKPYSLKKKINEINEILEKIKVPQQVGRLSRSLKDRNYWNSREWENWLLYFSLPALRFIPQFQVYEQHWQLLVEGIYLLMSESISVYELERADSMLKDFVSKTEELYGPTAMTFNIHQLLHVTQSVADWGPLWAHNGYSFESGNGKILRMIKASRGVLHQICRRIEYKSSARLLEKHILSQVEHSPVIEFVSKLEKTYTGKSIKLSNIRYFGKQVYSNHKYILMYNLSTNDTYSYHRLYLNDCLFTSCKRRTLRSRNCFAQTKSKTFIQIIEFIVDEHSQKEYTLGNLILTESAFNKCTHIERIIRICDEEVLISTLDIACVALCVDVNDVQYICAVPNKLHY